MMIVPRYAAVLGLLYVVLTLQVIAYRRKHKIALGNGGDGQLERLMRSHSNFAEFTPMGLLLLTYLEIKGLGPAALHALCASLTLGRLAHSQALPLRIHALRFVGMVLTLSSLVASSLLLALR